MTMPAVRTARSPDKRTVESLAVIVIESYLRYIAIPVLRAVIPYRSVKGRVCQTNGSIKAQRFPVYDMQSVLPAEIRCIATFENTADHPHVEYGWRIFAEDRNVPDIPVIPEKMYLPLISEIERIGKTDIPAVFQRHETEDVAAVHAME